MIRDQILSKIGSLIGKNDFRMDEKCFDSIGRRWGTLTPSYSAQGPIGQIMEQQAPSGWRLEGVRVPVGF